MDFPELWKATIEVRDGEYEYSDDIFIKGAATEEEARKEAEWQARHWFDDEEAKPVPETPGWFEEANGYRWIRQTRLTKITTLEELLASLFIVEAQKSK